jgi:dihydrofolate synthase/folylpolyglutamate synthase
VTYSETIAYLYGLEASRGWDLKLERVRAALEALGRPDRRFASVLIGGTNGKGSTAALVHEALVTAGHRVGIYTSPHLVHFTERIRIGRAEIAREAVVEGVARVRERASPEETGLTFFEVATLLAFLAFAESDIDVAVVEVGLGGRLDATNVIEPDCSAITSIGLDHEDYLGHTHAAIALEKAGIMRPDVATVLAPTLPEEARTALEARAAEVGARLVDAAAWRERVPAIALAGRHMRENGAVALALLDELAARVPSLAVGEDDVRTAFARVRWPGRIDVVRERPRVILDGAHNPEGAAALRREIGGIAGGPVRLVFAALADKRWREIAAELRPAAREVVVVPLRQPRAADPTELATEFTPFVPTRVGAAPAAEIDRLVREDDRTPIVAAGSLFLVGEIYEEWLRRSGRASVFDTTAFEESSAEASP